MVNMCITYIDLEGICKDCGRECYYLTHCMSHTNFSKLIHLKGMVDFNTSERNPIFQNIQDEQVWNYIVEHIGTPSSKPHISNSYYQENVTMEFHVKFKCDVNSKTIQLYILRNKTGDMECKSQIYERRFQAKWIFLKTALVQKMMHEKM